MKVEHITYYLREALIQIGYEHEEACKYSSHSLKATVLSSAAKARENTRIRQQLGGHAKTADGVALVYGRESFAEPLRRMQEILDWITAGVLLPDPTRSGPWTQHPGDRHQGLTLEEVQRAISASLGQWEQARQHAYKPGELLCCRPMNKNYEKRRPPHVH